nr:phospholipase D-like domain-containing protein [Mycobacterium sp. SMC-4]
MADHDGRLVVPGQTVWQTAHAPRFSTIIDGADYLAYVKAAMLRAQRRIMIIGWDLDYRTTFEPEGATMSGPNWLGLFLQWLVWRERRLQVYLLKSNLRLLPIFDAFWFGAAPVSWLNQITPNRMHFAVDGARPTGAVHHQKIVVVDDEIAFCGGIDLTLGRWDTREHPAEDPRRQSVGDTYGPRHEVAVAVDGDAAKVLAEQARDRWAAATGRRLPAVSARGQVWPNRLPVVLRDVEIGVARTMPTLFQRSEVREVEALNLAAIAAARDVIYLENQYLAARSLAEALAARLREPDGPEVVIVLPRSSESRLEQESMDSARQRLLRLLWEADEHGRLGVYWPAVKGGESVYVHSKILVVDDRMLRVGSSNLNNRSLGFDSECDVALEAPDRGREDVRREIIWLRDDLAAEHLGVPTVEFQQAVAEHDSFLGAVEALRGTGRSLRKFTEFMVSADASPFAENDLMDPGHVPPSMTDSVRSLAVNVITWPLTDAAPWVWSLARGLVRLIEPDGGAPRAEEADVDAYPGS